MARTMSARTRGWEPTEDIVMPHSMSYVEELMHSNPTMDSVRAQQLENWAEQREISNHNKHMYYDRSEEYDVTINEQDQVSLPKYILYSLLSYKYFLTGKFPSVVLGIACLLSSGRGWRRL
jgi:hypothetical protein